MKRDSLLKQALNDIVQEGRELHSSWRSLGFLGHGCTGGSVSWAAGMGGGVRLLAAQSPCVGVALPSPYVLISSQLAFEKKVQKLLNFGQ